MDPLINLIPAQVLDFFASKTGLAVGSTTLLLFTFIWSRIFAKAGYPSAWGLVAVIPIMWPILPVFLAFGSWPSLKEQRELRRVQRAVHRAEHRYQRAA